MATGIPVRRDGSLAGYRIEYPGKMPVDDICALPSCQPHSVPIDQVDGVLYQADNLPAMLWLAREGGLHHTIRSVYIDPPYATTMTFVDRDVNHAYEDSLDGAEYLEYLRRRIVAIRELLADDGSLFVHLDQKMVFEAKIILDEVFGRENFRNFITRKKCNTKNYTRKTFGNVSDHILFYTKTDQYVWHRPYDDWTPERLAEEYPCFDAATGRRFKKVPVHAPGVRNGETGTRWRGKLPPKGKHWQYPPRKLDELDAAGEIYWSPNGNPRRKVFYDSSKGIPMQDIWMDLKDAHNQNIRITGYPTEKNFDLVRRLIAATSNPGDWVLDCFCGSGTTLEAALSLGRKFIGIDMADAAIAASVKRLQQGRKVMGDFVGVRQSARTLEDEAPLFASLNQSPRLPTP